MSPIYTPGKVVLRGPTVNPLLLDSYAGAAAAYSLRQLSWAYGGPVVRVRRSSDNTESDFTATQVSDGTLAAWVGVGNNGFVRTWYDQSQNGQHLEQSTTANQPQIVSSGSLILKGTRPSIDFDGSNDRLINSAISLSQPITHVVVGSRDNASGTADVYFDSLNSAQHVFYNAGTTETPNQNWGFNASRPSLFPTFAYSTGTNLFLASIYFNSTSSNARIDGAQRVTGDPFTNGLSGLSVGNLRGNPTPLDPNYALDGKISEYIVFPSNQSGNIAAIESNINAYYAIY
jgi:hypothetical protein